VSYSASYADSGDALAEDVDDVPDAVADAEVDDAAGTVKADGKVDGYE
jgi:hypothetical protein